MERSKMTLLVGSLILGLTLASSLALAEGGKYQLRIKGESDHPKAQAELKTLKAFEINASGLNPNAVYTAWLVTPFPMKMEGAGRAPYSFSTDAQGNGRYILESDRDKLGQYQQVKIVLHKDGQAGNMDKGNLATAFIIPTSRLLSESE